MTHERSLTADDIRFPATTEEGVKRLLRLESELQSFQATAADAVVDFAQKTRATRLASLSLQVETVAAAAETLVIDISRVRDGTVTSLLTGTFTYDNGEDDDVEIDLSSLIDPAVTVQEGDLIRITRDYTAGGGPTPVVNSLVRAQFE